jgi:hypothetical protein
MKVKPYNTNLAAEYFVLSMLYRKGIGAHLTLGNKKSVDILIEKEDGSLLTVDVKGLAGKICWPMDNFKKADNSHFIVLVSFLDKISDHEALPESWIIPSTDVKKLLYVNPKGNRKGINRGGERGILTKGLHYRENWELLK